MKEYDIVKLKKDLPEKKLKKGMKGAIVMVYSEPNLPLSYEVEFIDDNGDTIAIETIRNSDLELN